MEDIFSRNGTLSQMLNVASTASSFRSSHSQDGLSRLGGIFKLIMSLFA